MSETSAALPPEDDHVTAGEYVLGVLTHEERRAVESRAEIDPLFAAEIDGWIARLSPLANSLAPVVPPASVKRRIWRTVFGANQSAKRSFITSLSFWQISATVSASLAVAALVALAYLGGPQTVDRPPTGFVALLAPADTGLSVVARIDIGNGVIKIEDAALETGERVPELWLIPDGETPKSLGLVKAFGASTVVIPAQLRDRFDRQATLAISLEPPGGSPTGLPTGPVVFSGPVHAI